MGIFEYQEPATLDQAAPVNGTWYTILDTTEKCRIYGITVNIEDVNEDIEAKLTIDGKTIPAAATTLTHSTNYDINWDLDAINQAVALVFNNGTVTHHRAFLMECKSVKVEVRKVTAGGTGNLTGIVDYGVLKRV